GPGRGVAAVRLDARPDQPGAAAQGRHLHRRARGRAHRAGLGVRRRHRLPDRPGRAAARADPRGHQGRRVRRGAVHLVLDRTQPRRHRRQAAQRHGHRGDRDADGADGRGVRAAGRRHGRQAVRLPPGGRARGVRRQAAVGGPGRGRDAAQAVPDAPGSQEEDRQVSAELPVARPRRLRRAPALRRMVAGTRLHPADLILPMFVKEGITEPDPVASMPGVYQHTLDSLRKAALEAAEAGVGGVILFGVPAVKDARGSAADDPDGILQAGLREVSAEVGDALVVMADTCLDEFTDHGHCGTLTDAGEVDNDATLERYASSAVAQARAGVQVIAPSGMMDGQVGAIRAALDAEGFAELPIMAYSAKYASAFYGPFRDAAECAPQFGDRASHQQDPAGAVEEALREVRLDLAAGADIVMVKPALSYLDVIRRFRDEVDVPVAAYRVSGEYAMIEAAAANGWVDRERMIMESLVSIKRAGAGLILTYWATEV